MNCRCPILVRCRRRNCPKWQPHSRFLARAEDREDDPYSQHISHAEPRRKDKGNHKGRKGDTKITKNSGAQTAPTSLCFLCVLCVSSCPLWFPFFFLFSASPREATCARLIFTPTLARKNGSTAKVRMSTRSPPTGSESGRPRRKPMSLPNSRKPVLTCAL